MSDPSREPFLLERLRSTDEETRYQALLELREEPALVTPSILPIVQLLESDASRPVRQLARELFQRHRPPSYDDDVEAPGIQENPGSGLLALISFGSSITGLLAVGLSMLSYYLLNRFPFPEPLDVLGVVLLVLVVPYVVLGVLLLMPGRLQKQVAVGYAYLSLVICLVLVAGLLPAFDTWWYFQFKESDQVMFRNFLSPFQVAMALMPVMAGQLLQIYYANQYLAASRPGEAPKSVDTREGGD